MRFLLNTNTCIYIIKNKPPQVLAKFQTIDIFDVLISSITIAELEYGVYKSQRQEENQVALSQFLIITVFLLAYFLAHNTGLCKKQYFYWCSFLG